MIFSAAFVNALARILPPLVRSHLNKRCVGVESSNVLGEGVMLRFSDGSTHEANVVIGADGIKSVIRMKGTLSVFDSSAQTLLKLGMGWESLARMRIDLSILERARTGVSSLPSVF